MNSSTYLFDQLEKQEISSPGFENDFIVNISRNLSSILSETPLDIVNSGIQIYDPFSIQESFERHHKKFSFIPQLQAISLRSKSTRNLHIRNSSFSNLIKPFPTRVKIEASCTHETNDIELDHMENLNKSRSRSILNQVIERKRKTSHEFKNNRKILQDVYNMKSNKSTKSLRKPTKTSHSKRSLAKISKFSSLTPTKPTNPHTISYAFLLLSTFFLLSYLISLLFLHSLNKKWVHLIA